MLDLPLLKKLRNGEADVLGDLAQQSWRDVAARMKGNSSAASGPVTKLLVRSALPHLDKSQLAQDGDDLGGLQYRDARHVSRNRDVLDSDKLRFEYRLAILQ